MNINIDQSNELELLTYKIAVLSMIGVPPASGFITKWYLVIGAMERQSLSILLVLLVSSFLNAIYFVPIVFNAFFKKEKSSDVTANETNYNKEVLNALHRVL